MTSNSLLNSKTLDKLKINQLNNTNNELKLSDIDLNITYNYKVRNMYRDGIRINSGNVKFIVEDSNDFQDNSIIGRVEVTSDTNSTGIRGIGTFYTALFNLYLLNGTINLLMVDIDDDTVMRLMWNKNKNHFEGTTEEIKENSNEVLVGWFVLEPNL